MLDAALAAELEAHRRAAHLGVMDAHRGQADRSVLARVLFVADADQRLLQQRDDGGQYFLATQAAQREVSADATLAGCERLWQMLNAPGPADAPLSRFALKYFRRHHPDIALAETDRPVDPGAEIPAAFLTGFRFIEKQVVIVPDPITNALLISATPQYF